MSVRKGKTQSLNTSEKLNLSISSATNSDKADMPIKIDPPVCYEDNGAILTLGTGDTGQLGLGPDVMEKTKPFLLSYEKLKSSGISDKDISSFIQICAGGMHTVCLSSNGSVYSFGCNDEGALGRVADLNPDKNSDDDETVAGLVKFPEEDVHIIMISAGDSHTGFLDDKGNVWVCGTFRGSSGPIGLLRQDEILKSPHRLKINNTRKRGDESVKIIKISSGQDHLAMLSEEGYLFTMGCAEQGQLGRVAERFSKDGGRSGIDSLLTPIECRIKGNLRFCDVWAGGFATFAKAANDNSIYACGLNNYGQLGLKNESNTIGNNKRRREDDSENPPSKIRKVNGTSDSLESGTVTTDEVRDLEGDAEEKLILRQGPLIQFMLTQSKAFSEKNWTQFAIGMHHVIALNETNKVYAIGRTEYGRLGLGPKILSTQSICQPKEVPFPTEKDGIKWVAVGEACSFAISKDSKRCYAWGLGSNLQLGQPATDDNEDCTNDLTSPSLMVGKNIQDKHIVMIDAGGQHTVIIARSNDEKTVAKSNGKPETSQENGKSDPKDKGDKMQTDGSEADAESKKKDVLKDESDKKMDTSNSDDPKDGHVFTEPEIAGRKSKNSSSPVAAPATKKTKKVRANVVKKKANEPKEEVKAAESNDQSNSLDKLSLTNGTIENQSLPSPPCSIIDETNSLLGSQSITPSMILLEKSCCLSTTTGGGGGGNFSTSATVNSGSNSIESCSLTHNWNNVNNNYNNYIQQWDNDLDLESSTSGSQAMGQFDEDASCKCTDGGSSHRSSIGGGSARSSLIIGGIAGSAGIGLFGNMLLLQNQPQPAQNQVLFNTPMRSNSNQRRANNANVPSQISRGNRSSGSRSCRQMAKQFHTTPNGHMSSVCSTNSESIGFPTTNADSASFDSVDSQSL